MCEKDSREEILSFDVYFDGRIIRVYKKIEPSILSVKPFQHVLIYKYIFVIP